MRLPRRWHGDAEPEEIRWQLGRGGALARGMRQASARDRLVPENTWQPGPVPPPRQARRAERRLQQYRSGPGPDMGRALALARALEQSTARNGRSR